MKEQSLVSLEWRIALLILGVYVPLAFSSILFMRIFKEWGVFLLVIAAILLGLAIYLYCKEEIKRRNDNMIGSEIIKLMELNF